MKSALSITFVILLGIFFAGCNNNSPSPQPSEAKKLKKTKSPSDEIETALAKLSAEDRKLAEAQKFCVISKESRLGSMGTPLKVMVEGEPVFICCDHCKDQVVKNQDAALKKAKELKAANSK